MKINEAFKARLDECFEERKTSVFKFTKEFGIARSTIVNLYNGSSKSPTLGTLYEICDALGISILQFLDCDLFRRKNIELYEK